MRFIVRQIPAIVVQLDCPLGKAYVYGYIRTLSDLYLVEGLK